MGFWMNSLNEMKLSYPKPVGYLGVGLIECPCFGELAAQLSSGPGAKPLAPADSKLGWFINHRSMRSGHAAICHMRIELSLGGCRGGLV